MPTRIKHRIEVLLSDAFKPNRFVELGLRRDVFFEPEGEVGTEFRFVALGIERWATAFGGSKGKRGAGVLEHVVGGCELLEPKSSFSSGIAQAIVGRDDH